MADEFDLQRFVRAQDPVLSEVLAELRAGRKRTHWMWFVFPQLRELGRSGTAQYYGIGSLAEAVAYLAHPVLGPRLVACAEAVQAVDGRSARQILGTPDDLKLRSSMTLFAAAAPDNPLFGEVIDKYFGGVPDPITTALLSGR